MSKAGNILNEMGDFNPEEHPLYQEADKYADDASQWHQGSGTHADTCLALVWKFLEEGKPEVAKMWVLAAKAEAEYLHECGGDWGVSDDIEGGDYSEEEMMGNWSKSISGQATLAAEQASKQVDPSFRWEDF